MEHPEATVLDYPAHIEEVVDVPVIAVGRLGDPEKAGDAIADAFHAALLPKSRTATP